MTFLGYVCQSSDCFAHQVLTNMHNAPTVQDFLHLSIMAFCWSTDFYSWMLCHLNLLSSRTGWKITLVYWTLCVLYTWCMRVVKFSQTCFVSPEFDKGRCAWVWVTVCKDVTRPACSSLNNNEAEFTETKDSQEAWVNSRFWMDEFEGTILMWTKVFWESSLGIWGFLTSGCRNVSWIFHQHLPQYTTVKPGLQIFVLL